MWAAKAVGNLGLHLASKSPRRRHAGAIGMSVRDDWHNRGSAQRCSRAAVDLADNWLNYTRLELTVYTDNAAALALYRKFGFEVEGTLKSYAFRDGRFIDAYAMARLRERSVPGRASGAKRAQSGAKATARPAKAARKRRGA